MEIVSRAPLGLKTLVVAAVATVSSFLMATPASAGPVTITATPVISGFGGLNPGPLPSIVHTYSDTNALTVDLGDGVSGGGGWNVTWTITVSEAGAVPYDVWVTASELAQNYGYPLTWPTISCDQGIDTTTYQYGGYWLGKSGTTTRNMALVGAAQNPVSFSITQGCGLSNSGPVDCKIQIYLKSE